ncbi:RNA-binding S4 domain-containing protein [Desulfoprunum benzoelyticum]|uniref:Ribosome-associated heat shock protein Hsp15 n=1 Tax=Desulfoprunum benzoelyticum TaxID=1506996 RepID=A0A840V102_9BACT|nr:RNA-binding S4 domain-containing protein [Desulfoprunum benzoelyticum]MBB5349354.1 ribosome-associated heat shock protein Hsp15 [Desulfoprunum benzoelyticum]MBM9531071.1 RNA-binding S4 domain-containing protein [Desulfoprunum benzoelyticum]
MEAAAPAVRLDKWLWAARFFKTRSMATHAVNGGKVRCNDARTKAGKTVTVGDQLIINNGHEEFRVTVLAVSGTRRPAREAMLLYEESEESVGRREEQREMRRLLHAGGMTPPRRPDKRDRRKIKSFLRKD